MKITHYNSNNRTFYALRGLYKVVENRLALRLNLSVRGSSQAPIDGQFTSISARICLIDDGWTCIDDQLVSATIDILSVNPNPILEALTPPPQMVPFYPNGRILKNNGARRSAQ